MFTLLKIIGIPPGALQPTQIQIVGSFSCPSGSGGIPVELRVTAPLGGPITTFSQLTSTGALGTPPIGSVVFNIPAWATAVCGAKVEFEVRGDCGRAGQPQWTPWQPFIGEIECFCPRISLQASYGACSGNPLKQTITLTATIMLKPGSTSTFSWDFGDGQHASGGSLTNTTSNWNTPLTLTQTHDYDPSGGPYSACLSSPECPSACITVRPNCNGCCDEVTVTVDTLPLPCVPAGGGTVSIQFSASLLPTGCTGPFEWKVTDVTTNTVLQPFALGSSTFSYPFSSAGTYRVNVRVQQAGTCDDPVLTDSITFTLVACALCPALAVTATVSGCAPTNPLVSLNTQLSWPGGSGPAATGYYWTIDDPGSTRKAQRFGPASLDSSTGWTGTLATPSGAVDLSQPGTYSVSVRAQVPGVPADCDPTDSATIVIPPCQCPAPISNANQEWTVTNTTAPLGPNSFQTLSCDSAALTIGLSVDPGNYQASNLRYRWDFGDGSPVVTGQGAAWASRTHTFTNPTPGQSRTYTVTVTVSVAGSPCPPFSRTASIIVPGCSTQDCPPGQHRDASGNCVPDTQNGGCWCILLIIAAMILGLVACFAGSVAFCISNPYLGIFAGVVAVVALILLALWLAFCARFMCNVFTMIRKIVMWIMIAAPIWAIIAGLIGGGLACGIVSGVILFGYWGMVLLILDNVGPRLPCPLVPLP